MRYTYGSGKYFDLWAGNQSFDIDGNGKQVDNIVADNTSITVTFSDGGGGGAASGTIYYRVYAEPK